MWDTLESHVKSIDTNPQDDFGLDTYACYMEINVLLLSGKCFHGMCCEVGYSIDWSKIFQLVTSVLR